MIQYLPVQISPNCTTLIIFFHKIADISIMKTRILPFRLAGLLILIVFMAQNSAVCASPVASIVTEMASKLTAEMAEAQDFAETEDETQSDYLSQTGVYFSRPKLVKLLTHDKKILLTFDDGPHPRTTPKILEILKKRNLKAIFFVLGLQAEKYPHLVKQIHEAGHEIGNHTYNHKNMAQLSEEQIRYQLEKTNQLIENATGERPRFLRPPYGALNKQVLRICQSSNMNIMLWTIDPKDWQNKNEAMILGNLDRQLGLNGSFRGGAVLLHDIYPSTVRALEPFLDKLAINEYQIADANSFDSSINNFWAATSPELLKNARFKRHFPAEVSGHDLLVKMIGEAEKVEVPSSMALLKASRNGDLLLLLARSNSF